MWEVYGDDPCIAECTDKERDPVPEEGSPLNVVSDRVTHQVNCND